MHACKCQLFTDEGSRRLPKRLNYCFSVLASAMNRSILPIQFTKFEITEHNQLSEFKWQNKSSKFKSQTNISFKIQCTIQTDFITQHSKQCLFFIIYECITQTFLRVNSPGETTHKVGSLVSCTSPIFALLLLHNNSKVKVGAGAPD